IHYENTPATPNTPTRFAALGFVAGFLLPLWIMLLIITTSFFTNANRFGWFSCILLPVLLFYTLFLFSQFHQKVLSPFATQIWHGHVRSYSQARYYGCINVSFPWWSNHTSGARRDRRSHAEQQEGDYRQNRADELVQAHTAQQSGHFQIPAIKCV